MILKSYQKKAIDNLVKVNKILLGKEGSRVCVLKAPTGSGKTKIIAEFLDQLVREDLPSRFAFIWISGYKLHEQSRQKLESYLESSRFTFSYLDEIQGLSFKQNEIVFVNWHSLTKQDKNGEFTNLFMKDNESGRNLSNYINNTRDNGINVILLVDESHYHYWSERSQELIQDIIQPKLTIEISATPKLLPTAEMIEFEEAGQVTVRFEEVVAEGMIKNCVVINPEIGLYKHFSDVADEAIIAAALEKQKEISQKYKELNKSINPLILVQLPSEGEKTSALDKTKAEYIEKILKEQHGITTDNKQLGIWLSDRKINLEGIEKINNQTKVLIFKQAIALGWDCPRAHILVMFRDIKSPIFEIQTVGRILRMPEAKHYTDNILNQGYVYTNLPKIEIAKDEENRGFFKINHTKRKTDYKEIMLPSVYLSRLDYGDLTLEFRKIFIKNLNDYFYITDHDSPISARDKVSQKLDLLPENLTQALISDAILEQIDTAKSTIGDVIDFSVPEHDIKFKYEIFAKACSLPFAPVRSHTKIQQGLYDWFDKYLGYSHQSRLEIQRIVVCSEKNQKIIKEIIDTAKEEFKNFRRIKMAKEREQKLISWDVPVEDYYNELYEETSSENYALEKCYLRKNRSNPEEVFEGVVNNNNSIEWWYKNGEEREIYFCIPYFHPEDEMLHSFYPDYIVQFSDGTIGIYDTKSGNTITSRETAAKSNALQAYLKAELSKGKRIKGGIINSRGNGLFIYNGEIYNPDHTDPHWKRFEII